jgi:hypothetical protein
MPPAVPRRGAGQTGVAPGSAPAAGLPSPIPAGAVNCGPIIGGNGASSDVIAFPGGAGVAGCTEAVMITNDYVVVPRDDGVAIVDGWTCKRQPDPAVPHVCSDRGLTVGLRGAAAPETPGAATRSAAPARDVNCGTVPAAGGGRRAVLARVTATGVADCQEAVAVAADYAQKTGDAGTMTVDGWTCAAAECTRDGLVIAIH